MLSLSPSSIEPFPTSSPSIPPTCLLPSSLFPVSVFLELVEPRRTFDGHQNKPLLTREGPLTYPNLFIRSWFGTVRCPRPEIRPETPITGGLWQEPIITSIVYDEFGVSLTILLGPEGIYVL